jgi:hypothetical protein
LNAASCASPASKPLSRSPTQHARHIPIRPDRQVHGLNCASSALSAADGVGVRYTSPEPEPLSFPFLRSSRDVPQPDRAHS